MTQVDTVTDELRTEFAHRIPAATVEQIVHSAEQDLDGQVQPGAYPELVHRLAHIRLAVLTD